MKPGTRIYHRLLFGHDKGHTQVGPTRQFRTLPAADSVTPLNFTMVSCQSYHSFMYGNDGKSIVPEADRRLGYPSYAAMLELQPDFYIGTGDTSCCEPTPNKVGTNSHPSRNSA